MYNIKVVDVRTGEVALEAITGNNLNGRTFKGALQRAGLTTKGKHRFIEAVVYIKDDTLTAEQTEGLARALRRYQAEEDTRELGVEFEYFMNLYLTVDERARIHAGELRFNEAKLQAGLTEEDKATARRIHALRFAAEGAA